MTTTISYCLLCETARHAPGDDLCPPCRTRRDLERKPPFTTEDDQRTVRDMTTTDPQPIRTVRTWTEQGEHVERLVSLGVPQHVAEAEVDAERKLDDLTDELGKKARRLSDQLVRIAEQAEAGLHAAGFPEQLSNEVLVLIARREDAAQAYSRAVRNSGHAQELAGTYEVSGR